MECERYDFSVDRKHEFWAYASVLDDAVVEPGALRVEFA
jgi:hypothetical protein